MLRPFKHTNSRCLCAFVVGMGCDLLMLRLEVSSVKKLSQTCNLGCSDLLVHLQKWVCVEIQGHQVCLGCRGPRVPKETSAQQASEVLVPSRHRLRRPRLSRFLIWGRLAARCPLSLALLHLNPRHSACTRDCEQTIASQCCLYIPRYSFFCARVIASR